MSDIKDIVRTMRPLQRALEKTIESLMLQAVRLALRKSFTLHQNDKGGYYYAAYEQPPGYWMSKEDAEKHLDKIVEDIVKQIQ